MLVFVQETIVGILGKEQIGCFCLQIKKPFCKRAI